MFLKKIVAACLAVVLTVPLFSVAAATNVNDNSVYIKQETNTTCTLCAMAMIFRRKAILDGNENWSVITEASMKAQGNWPNGLSGSPKYKDADRGLDMKATSKRLYNMRDTKYVKNPDPKGMITKLKGELDKHPEGIVLYVYLPTGPKTTKWRHAVALTSYDKNGNFYCLDSGGSKKKIINLMDSILTDQKRANTESLETLLSYSVKIWYMNTSANKKTNGAAPAPTTPSVTPAQKEEACTHTSYDSYGKCKSCGKVYDMKIASMTATTYQAVKDGVPVRNRPYSAEKTIKTLSKGAKVTVVASGKNSAGNLWYKLKDGTWVYSANLTKVTATTQSTTPTPKKTVADGTYTITTKLNSALVLDVADGSKENGANVQLWKSNNTAAQQFKVTHIGNGYYRFVNVNASKALDAKDGGTKAGTNVWQYSVNNTDAQIWQIADAGGGYYSIICKKSGLYLDVSGGNAKQGENIQLWTGNGSDAQKWKFTKVTTITKECTHASYDSYGKCKSCGKVYDMKITSMTATTYQAVKNDVPVRNRPYSPEKTIKTLSKGTKVTVVASGKNAAGNLWYKLKDGTWIYSGNLQKSCAHASYDSYGKCKSCGEVYPMKITSMTATTYKTTKNDVPVRNRPYSPEKIIKTLSKGTKVTVVASGKNSAGNLWYKLKDGTWIFSGNLQKQ